MDSGCRWGYSHFGHAERGHGVHGGGRVGVSVSAGAVVLDPVVVDDVGLDLDLLQVVLGGCWSGNVVKWFSIICKKLMGQQIS